MKHIIRTSSCIAAALALGGCQNFIQSLGFGPKDSAQTERRAEVFGSEEMERGRLALKAGHTAMAIQQFRMAALNEDYAADAFNGLGVAYATLGRADLAERYFRTAVELDSGNPKYAANLARFYNSELGNSQQALAMRNREAEDTLRRAEIAAAVQGLTGSLAGADVGAPDTVTVARPSSQLARSNDRELRITSAPERLESDSRAEVAVRSNASNTASETTTERPTPRSRITLVGSSTPSKDKASSAKGPVRISVSRGGGRWASRPRAATYPLRVALKRQD